jgi:hypothetical protein
MRQRLTELATPVSQQESHNRRRGSVALLCTTTERDISLKDYVHRQ